MVGNIVEADGMSAAEKSAMAGVRATALPSKTNARLSCPEF